MSNQPQVHVNVQTGTGEILRIVATLLLFGGAGAIAWTVAQGPNAEMAASGLSMMLVMMIKLAYARGRIAIPKGGGAGAADDFAATKGVITQVVGEYQRALARASMPVMALIAAGYAISFLILRAGVAAALGVFSNLYVAGGAAAVLGAIVVFPSLVPNMIRGLKSKGVVTDAPTPAPAPTQQMAPVQQVTTSVMPQDPALATSADPSGPGVRRVVIKKKENSNHV